MRNDAARARIIWIAEVGTWWLGSEPVAGISEEAELGSMGLLRLSKHWKIIIFKLKSGTFNGRKIDLSRKEKFTESRFNIRSMSFRFPRKNCSANHKYCSQKDVHWPFLQNKPPQPASKSQTRRASVSVVHGGPWAFERHIYLASVRTKSALGPNASAIKL